MNLKNYAALIFFCYSTALSLYTRCSDYDIKQGVLRFCNDRERKVTTLSAYHSPCWNIDVMHCETTGSYSGGFNFFLPCCGKRIAFNGRCLSKELTTDQARTYWGILQRRRDAR